MRICISSQLTHSRKDHVLAEGKAGEQTKRVVELEYDCHPPRLPLFFSLVDYQADTHELTPASTHIKTLKELRGPPSPSILRHRTCSLALCYVECFQFQYVER